MTREIEVEKLHHTIEWPKSKAVQENEKYSDAFHVAQKGGLGATKKGSK